MSTNGIAVVIPLYIGAQWIEATLRSVLRQSRMPDEILVVDNNSTDGSPELAASFPGVTLLSNPVQGGGASRQMGIEKSRCEMIACLDQDDLGHPDHLRQMEELLNRHPDCSAVAASCLVFGAADGLSFPPLARGSDSYDPWEVFPSNHIATPSCVVLRRSVIESGGGWPVDISFCSDHHAWLRLGIHAPLIQSRGVTVGYRRHSDSISRAALAQKVSKSVRTIKMFVTDHEAALSRYLEAGRYSSERRAQLTQRLVGLKAMAAFAIAVVESDEAALRPPLLAFEDSLLSENDAVVESSADLAMWLLYWYLCDRRACLADLLAAWPRSAPRTRQAFRKKVAVSRILPRRLLREPLRPILWRVIWEQRRAVLAKLPIYRR